MALTASRCYTLLHKRVTLTPRRPLSGQPSRGVIWNEQGRPIAADVSSALLALTACGGDDSQGDDKSPAPALRYGLTAWLECSTPQTGCHQISSPGAFGFTPWIDRDAGYYAILGMRDMTNFRTHFGGQLEQQLKPLIIRALQQTGN